IEGGFVEPVYGCTDSDACNFNPLANTDSGNCEYYEDCSGECGGSAEYDSCGVCDGDGEMMCWDGSESCDISECPTEPQYYTELPEQTGVTNLVVVSNVQGLELGDEVGFFDSNGILNSGDCSNQTGRILVGAGVYNGNQLEVVATGSLDFCDISGGAQMPGFVSGNPIEIKVWSNQMDYEYTPDNVTFSIGDGNWGNLISYIDMLDGNIYGCMDSEAMNYDMYANIDDGSCYFMVEQEISLIPGFLNNISFNVNLDDMNPESVFADSDILIASNDQGEYFMPMMSINSIGEVNNSDGYLVYFNGDETQTMQLVGMPASLNDEIYLDPYSINYIGFTPQYAMSVEEIFSEMPIFIVSDQFGNYYVPALNINTIDESGGMQPGRGYMVYHGSEEVISFTYPEALGRTISVNQAAVEARESLNYDVVETGNAYPILITEVIGNINVGDEIAAYANGELVGATRISNKDESISLTAWGNLDKYGLESSGFKNGDKIDLRLWRYEANLEIELVELFDNSNYGQSVFSMGKVEIIEKLDLPEFFSLEQNYPNPFNPNTSIAFTLTENAQSIQLSVFDIQGNFITTLLNNRTMKAGNYSIEWNATDKNGIQVPAGIYFYSLQSGQTIITRKMVLLK
ncbi:MAG: hypothetical protein CMF96_09495, partial [Candidatus Marinimicrobia bacterium]|nr:hypothetical protein [Candidatus Neomarinimicrobiota bacterium]